MTQYPTKSHYPDTEFSSLCPILLMLNARLRSVKNQCYKSVLWLDREPNSCSPTCEAHALPIRLLHQVSELMVIDPTESQQYTNCGLVIGIKTNHLGSFVYCRQSCHYALAAGTSNGIDKEGGWLPHIFCRSWGQSPAESSQRLIKMYSCCYLAWFWELLRQNMDRLVRCQDIAIKQDIGSCCIPADGSTLRSPWMSTVTSHYKC